MKGPPETHGLFADLTEAVDMACPMICVAVIVKDESAPSHRIGGPEGAQQLLGLDCVQATLADGMPRMEPPPPNSALSEAAFIAVEPLSFPYQPAPNTVIAFAGKYSGDCERAVSLVHSLATETANELMILKQAPFLATAFAEIECGVTVADPNLPDTPLIYANAAFVRMTGYPKAQLLGRSCRFLQGELTDQPGVQRIRNALARGTDCTAVVTNFRRNGESFENRLKLRPIRTSDGALSHIIGIQLDVTNEYAALDSLARQKHRYESLVKAQSSYIWHMSATGELLDADPNWLALAGLSSSSAQPDLAAIRNVLTAEAAAAFRDGWVTALKDVTPFEIIYQVPAHSQSPRWFMDRVTPVLDDEGTLLEWISVGHEITDLKRAAEEDRLTGLLSSEGFTRRLNERLNEGKLHPFSQVMAVDVQALRKINNTQGYEAGDEVLRELARRLRREVSEHGLVGRTGGDEFTLLVPLDHESTPRQWRKRIASVFDEPFRIGQVSLHIEGVFGYARTRNRTGNARQLMTDAELAMHSSQPNPAHPWTEYTQTLQHETLESVELTTKLRHAIEATELVLHYQPQIDLATGRIVSAEALLRWPHPQLGFIPPGQFIPLAEQSQLIGPIGDWVLRQACRDLRAWRDAGLAVTPISVNLSLIQFQLGRVPAKVHQALTEFNLSPGDLTLEITESVFEQQGLALKNDLQALSAMGVRLSLDDFGTGYASLGHLKDYPFNEIKIDKSFVWQLDQGTYGQAIVKAVTVIAAALEADVVGEGIESQNHLDILRHLGCTRGQGFFYSPAVPEVSWRQLLVDQETLA